MYETQFRSRGGRSKSVPREPTDPSMESVDKGKPALAFPRLKPVGDDQPVYLAAASPPAARIRQNTSEHSLSIH